MTGPAGGALRFARFLLAGKSKTQKARQVVRLPPLRGRNLSHVVAHGATPNPPPRASPRGRYPLRRWVLPTTLIDKINKVVGCG